MPSAARRCRSSPRVVTDLDSSATKASCRESSRTPGKEREPMPSAPVRVPRYHQIAQSLRERILDRRLAAGERLDNQRQLAREFGVTLMTLRQALEVLERDRLIARRHGLGTFVASPSVDYDILQFQRLAADLSAHGEAVGTRFLGSRFAPADRHAAQALGVK